MAVRVDPIVSYRIPKPTGGTRLMARLTAHDAARWDALAVRLGPSIEQRLGRGVLANRLATTVGPLRLRPLGPALTAARRSAVQLSRTPLLLRTDVAAFYPSVTPSVLWRSLRAACATPSDAALAAEMLEGWGSEGYAGLPIGPPGSAVMANAVLTAVDRALTGVGFLRWVDDYLVAMNSHRRGLEVVERLDHALDRIGLRRSEPKTRVLEGGRPSRWPGTLSGL